MRGTFPFVRLLVELSTKTVENENPIKALRRMTFR